MTPELVTKDSGSSDGSVTLDFSAGSGAFDYLGAGDTLTLTYTVTIDDGDGGVTSKDFVINITGTNDAPVIADIAAQTLPEQTDTNALTTTVAVTFTDVDLDGDLDLWTPHHGYATATSFVFRPDALYVNDGVYGNLAELKWIGPHFAMRPVRPARTSDATVLGFDLFGPTCDSIDSMPGPHWLPADVAMGEWIEVGMMGAYSNALRTAFNGFRSGRHALLADGAWYLAEAEDDREPALRQALAA